MNDQRARPRQRTLKAGKIVFNDQGSVIDCTLRNLSATGARLQVTSVIGVPDAFTLTFDARSQPCQVVWRSTSALGVLFRG